MLRFARGLIGADSRGALRDPIIPLFALVPFLAIAFVAFAVPPLLETVGRFVPVDTADGFDRIRETIHLFLLLTAPLMWGTVYGFFALDDRDDGISHVLSASPVSPLLLLLLRLLAPAVLTAVYAGIIMALLPLPAAGALLWSGTVAMMVLEAPLMALIIGGIAENKVEGLAVSKASSLLFLGALFGLLLEEPRAYLGMVSPHYWAIVPLVRGVPALHPAIAVLIGVGYHLGLIGLFARRYVRRR